MAHQINAGTAGHFNPRRFLFFAIFGKVPSVFPPDRNFLLFEDVFFFHSSTDHTLDKF
jgi:hypothetical protein